ncbi:MAG: iron-containing alcohol dehydrogenase [Anaerolineaceae bacterium]|nr:iron-containing alcohol dehydrogenase [Anaerolineaceae bacterium]
MAELAPVISGETVLQGLVNDLQARFPTPILLVMDQNTRAACGGQVEEMLHHAGLPLISLVLPGVPRVAADETSIIRVLQALNGEPAVLVGIGSGTITDIVRFTAFQTRLPFLSLPTAPSVDAYTSYTASITIAGVKYSFPTKTAEGVYVHLPTLCAAPARMTAAGFGDMVAKYTGLADWKLAHILVDDTYDPQTALKADQALRQVVLQAGTVRAAAPEGISALVDSLLISGHCMVAVKSSRPAAGSEHSLAHFWEIRHHQEGLPESLHGEKTGAAAVIIARLYEALRCLSRGEAARRLERFVLPDPDLECQRIRAAYGAAADDLIAASPSFLGPLRRKTGQVIERLLSRWEEVQAVAETVPPAAEIISTLAKAGSLSDPSQIHISTEEVGMALNNAMFVRDRFTILELNRMLDLTQKIR